MSVRNILAPTLRHGVVLTLAVQLPCAGYGKVHLETDFGEVDKARTLSDDLHCAVDQSVLTPLRHDVSQGFLFLSNFARNKDGTGIEPL